MPVSRRVFRGSSDLVCMRGLDSSMFGTEGKGSGDRPRNLEVSGFRVLFEETFDIVYGYFARRSSSAEAAEDLTQETFLSALRALQGGVNVEAPLPWVMTIARRRLVDHYRGEGRSKALMQRLSALEGPAVERASDEVDDSVILALHQVSGPQRVALVLRYVDDLSVREVAAFLERSERATESLLSRGRRSLRQSLERTQT